MYKMCRTCKTEKELSGFRKDASQRDGYRTECKVCSRNWHKSAYMDKYSDQVKARNASRQAEIAPLVLAYKAERGCKCCTEKEPICLEFHHLDPSTKEFALSTSRNRSWDKIQAEMEKCVVVCSNCHKKIHAGLIVL